MTKFLQRTLIVNVPLVLILALVASACSKPADEASGEEAAAAADHPEEPAGLVRTPAAEGARVFIKTPADGATVTSPVTVVFGVENMAIVAAGTDQEHSGHHHIIVDAALPDLNAPIPKNDHYIHFGDGSTSTELELDPGEHTLQLLLGDHRHIPHEPAISSRKITITVADAPSDGDSADEEAADEEAADEEAAEGEEQVGEAG